MMEIITIKLVLVTRHVNQFTVIFAVASILLYYGVVFILNLYKN